MLYRLTSNYRSLTPVAFLDCADENKLEKDLENLIAANLFSTLYEGMPLFPFHQERRLQSEADIYALDEAGEIVIFELKRGVAGSGALEQLLRYAECAGRWSYYDIEKKYLAYQFKEDGDPDLQTAHQNSFYLEHPVSRSRFNANQHLVVVGNAADRDLVQSVDFWRKKGISIDFLPYRIYRMKDELLFEFFAKPYDLHINPSTTKGVLFDTNRSYDDDADRIGSLKAMLEKRRISAYGSRRDAVRSLSTGDLVFYSHRGVGIVAAALVVGKQARKDGDHELYWDVKFLTPVPQDLVHPPAMSFQQVKEVTAKSFYWARIQKVPYLTKEEADHLLVALKEMLGTAAHRRGVVAAT
jgi:hypothetical protein